MKHYGDITKLSGKDLPVVDIVIGGSPCQDLSIAGAQAGLAGERSGLFMDQIRIVKEMRKNNEHTKRADDDIRPRYILWENVPGAFSSNKGADFKTVLSEIVRIADPSAPDVPMPQTGRWPKAGILYDEMGSWSIAWRVHDAQFWGVPQRRRRISIIADLGGLSAPEVLFERQGMRRDLETSREAREEAPGDAGEGIERTGESIDLPAVFDGYQHNGWRESETVGPVTTGHNRIRGGTTLISQIYGAAGYGEYTPGCSPLRASGGDLGNGGENLMVSCGVVRRLTPLECERLQGFPDGWTDIGEWIDSNGRTRQTTDSARYKALGNSIALPFWQYLARRIVAQYEHEVTIGSLFDGIGGFPLVFERCGARAIWASEIEDFAIAVTKKHFPEENDDNM